MNTYISVESTNAQIIADALENGFLYSHAAEMVNVSRAKQGLQHMLIFSVRNCTQRMNPMRTAIGKLKQGSSRRSQSDDLQGHIELDERKGLFEEMDITLGRHQ